MLKRTQCGLMLAFLLVSVFALAFKIEFVNATGTIYIRADGSVEGTDKIISSDNITYTFTGDINDTVVVERNNITIEGAGYTLQGTGDPNSKGIFLTGIANVTIRNTQIRDFWIGIVLYTSSTSVISGNTIANNEFSGIVLEYSSSNNIISGNNVTLNHQYGIWIDSSSHNSIFGNKITDNFDGIWIGDSSDNSIVGNNITVRQYDEYGVILDNSSNIKIFGNNLTGGIDLQISNGNNVTENSVSSTAQGIFLEHSNYNSISRNVITNNLYGIIIWLSTGNVLRSNNITDNSYNMGIYGIDDNLFNLGGVSLSSYHQDIDPTNTISGKPVYYWVNQHGNRIPDDAGFVAAINCTEITVSNLKLSNNVQGILLAYTTDSVLQNLTTTGNQVGIQLVGSDNNTITANNATQNEFGISLYYSSRNNFTQNIVTENDEFGVAIGIGLDIWGGEMFPWATIPSEGNVLRGNLISNNNYWRGLTLSNLGTRYTVIVDNNITNNRNGIYLREASNNSIYHNNFVDNNPQVYIETSGYANFWDNGVEGNYWNNYTGADSDYDGIGDTPQIMDASNQDNHPLMGMFSDFNATSEDHVQTICNSTISSFQFNGTAITFNVSGENGTTGFCRICIPTTLMNGTYTVFVNGTQISYSLLQCSNETYNYLYFNYTHSTQELIITPEFLSFLILPIFMIATLLAVVIYKKRTVKTGSH